MSFEPTKEELLDLLCDDLLTDGNIDRIVLALRFLTLSEKEIIRIRQMEPEEIFAEICPEPDDVLEGLIKNAKNLISSEEQARIDEQQSNGDVK